MSRPSKVDQFWISRFQRRGLIHPDSPCSYWLDGNHDRKGTSVPSLDELKELKIGPRYGPTVCIVEIESRKQFQDLESKLELKLDARFIENHFKNLPQEWSSRWPLPRLYGDDHYLGSRHRQRDYTDLPDMLETKANLETEFDGAMEWDYIDGTFEYHGIGVSEDMSEEIPKEELESNSEYFAAGEPKMRGCFYTNWHGEKTLCSNTRISYYRVNEQLYLFLVDAPLALQDRYKQKPRHLRPTLRLPYASNWGGILMPLMLAKESERFGLAESLVEIFQYRWQRELLFNHEPSTGKQAFPAPPLCYMMSYSLWWTHLLRFEKEIKYITCRGTETLVLKHTKPLRDIQEDLVDFVNAPLAETIANIPGPIRAFWRNRKTPRKISQDMSDDNLISNFKEMKKKGEILEEKFLMHAFQILTTSVSVRSAWGVTLLVNFATIFFPLSFVAAAFGMNFGEDGLSSNIGGFIFAAIIALGIARNYAESLAANFK